MSNAVANDELRGSTPVYTAKDILVKLDTKLDEMDKKVDQVGTQVTVLVSQDLAPRVTELERFQNRLMGLTWAAGALGLIGTALGAWTALSQMP